MKTYTMSFAAAIQHTPAHPERTARKQERNFDVTFKEWPAREAMARSLRMQEKREPRYDDWRPCIALATVEGY